MTTFPRQLEFNSLQSIQTILSRYYIEMKLAKIEEMRLRTCSAVPTGELATTAAADVDVAKPHPALRSGIDAACLARPRARSCPPAPRKLGYEER